MKHLFQDPCLLLAETLRHTFPATRADNQRFESGHCAILACALAEAIGGEIAIIFRIPSSDEDSDHARILSHVVVEAHGTTFDFQGDDARDRWTNGFWERQDVEWDDESAKDRAEMARIISEGRYDTAWDEAEIDRLKALISRRLTKAGYFELALKLSTIS